MIVELDISLLGEDKMNMKIIYRGLYTAIALEIFIILFYFYTIFLEIVAIKTDTLSNLTKNGIFFITWIVVSVIFFYIIVLLKKVDDYILKNTYSGVV